MNYSNINLKDNYEKDQPMLYAYSVNDLLLEISCNIKDINPQEVLQQFEESLQSKVQSAREIMLDNLQSITEYAQQERNEN